MMYPTAYLLDPRARVPNRYSRPLYCVLHATTNKIVTRLPYGLQNRRYWSDLKFTNSILGGGIRARSNGVRSTNEITIGLFSSVPEPMLVAIFIIIPDRFIAQLDRESVASLHDYNLNGAMQANVSVCNPFGRLSPLLARVTTSRCRTSALDKPSENAEQHDCSGNVRIRDEHKPYKAIMTLVHRKRRRMLGNAKRQKKLLSQTIPTKLDLRGMQT